VKRFIITVPLCRICFVVGNKSRRTSWAEHVVFMEDKTYAHKTLHVNSGKIDRGEKKK
jgi:hypothetical protein